MTFNEWWKPDQVTTDTFGLATDRKLAEQAWLASRKAALEEAAKVCEEYIAAADSAVRPLVALGCPAVILALIDRP